MSLPPPGAVAGANDNTREDIFKEIDILIGLEHANVIFLKGARRAVRAVLAALCMPSAWAHDALMARVGARGLRLQRCGREPAPVGSGAGWHGLPGWCSRRWRRSLCCLMLCALCCARCAAEYYEEGNKVYLIMELLSGGQGGSLRGCITEVGLGLW